MKRLLHLLVDHWYVPFFAVAAVLGYWFVCGPKRKRTPLASIALELGVIEAGRQAKELQARIGAEQAAAEVRKVHATAWFALDERDRQRATELAGDPVALSKFLVRAAQNKPG